MITEKKIKILVPAHLQDSVAQRVDYWAPRVDETFYRGTRWSYRP